VSEEARTLQDSVNSDKFVRIFYVY
jgi:hypothetical protein